MDSQSLTIIVDFYEHIDIFLIIIIRLLSFFMMLPVFSGANIPTTAKVGLSVFVAFLIFTSGSIPEIHYHDSIIGYFNLILQEFMTGVTLGIVVSMVFNLIYLAGQLVDYQIGFSMVSVFDPISQIQVPITGNLFYFVICMFLVLTGGLNAFIAAIFQSYTVIPIGAASLLGNSELMMYIITFVMDFFILSIKISMPILGSIIVIDVAMGLLVKAAPQMNVFVVGIPIKLLAGLALLVVLTPLLRVFYDITYDEAYRAIYSIIRGMRP